MLSAAGLLAPLMLACAEPSPNIPDPAAAVNSDVAELESLDAAGKITELRKAFNGNYGASLSYYGEQMTYYVALFQQNRFWRVLTGAAERNPRIAHRTGGRTGAASRAADSGAGTAKAVQRRSSRASQIGI
jgi:Protein of unknown function (DUF2968)